jgi:hypothetical protein
MVLFFYPFLLVQKGIKKDTFSAGIFPSPRRGKTSSETSPSRRFGRDGTNRSFLRLYFGKGYPQIKLPAHFYQLPTNHDFNFNTSSVTEQSEREKSYYSRHCAPIGEISKSLRSSK